METSKSPSLDWPLMENNILDEDKEALIDFLRKETRLTQAGQVEAFEKEWSEWLGVKKSVFVNSGSSANLITLSALREKSGPGEVIVPVLTWSSDIASVLHCGFEPVFVDIDPRSLAMKEKGVMHAVTSRTRAVFLTHILGYNGLTKGLLDFLRDNEIPLIEDVCESHGASFEGRKLGTFGLMSNFSFYYAHHMSTVEGGMVSTDDEELYQMLRMFRSHGLVRESKDPDYRKKFHEAFPDLNPEFIFAFPAYNVRSTEINAVLGRRQLLRLDTDIEKRNRNLKLFLSLLNPDKYRTQFNLEGCSNYALTLVLQEGFKDRAEKVMKLLAEQKVEFRRGCSGGGNQLRQPYLKKIFKDKHLEYPEVEHIHFYGFYIGNYPGLPAEKIERLCALLNGVE